jgi:hypothetical protein
MRNVGSCMDCLLTDLVYADERHISTQRPIKNQG